MYEKSINGDIIYSNINISELDKCKLVVRKEESNIPCFHIIKDDIDIGLNIFTPEYSKSNYNLNINQLREITEFVLSEDIYNKGLGHNNITKIYSLWEDLNDSRPDLELKYKDDYIDYTKIIKE